MKIALVVPGGVDRGGTHRVIPALLWLIERLAWRHEVHVFSLGQEQRPGKWELLGARVRDSGRLRPRRLRALLAMLAEHRRRPFDVVHAFWAGGPGVCAALFRFLTGVPVVLTLPGGDLAALPEIAYGARLSWRGRAWVRLAIAGSDRLIVPSDWMARQARALGHRADTVGFGVALDHWAARAPRRRQAGEPLRLLHVANLNKVKDQPVLLAAMARLREKGVAFRLDIAGEDQLNGEIQALCSQLDLGREVRFHGFVPQDELRPLAEGADLMAVSSRHEGVPIAVLESAALGVPTVGTEVGIIADWAPGAAISVPPGDSRALAEAIAGLAADEDKRMRLAHAAQGRTLAHDADGFAQEMERVYAELAGA